MPDTTPDIAITRKVPGTPELPGVDANIRVLGEGYPDRGELVKFVAGADILISMFSDRVDRELLDAAGPRLKGVCNFAVGYNNIDLQTCADRGIPVTNTPDAVTEGTANIAWALLLAVSRRLIEGDRFARSGAWAKHGNLGMAEFLGLDITGKTLLIVGAGRIGAAVARRGTAWGMRTLYVARTPKWDMELAPIAARRVSLDEGVREADIISVHTPLTEQTRHLIGRDQIASMKPTAILINTARGPVVDEAALAEALKNRRIWGAGLDVFEEEPAIHPDLLELDNITMTPHVGSAEIRYREAMTRMACENAAAILKGETPPNLVG